MLAPKSRVTAIVIGLAVLVLLGGVAVTAQEGAAVGRIAAEGRQFEALVDGADWRRAPLYGEPVGGAAFDEYEAALASLDEHVLCEWGAYREAFDAGEADANELAQALVAANRSSLEALRRGAHAADASWEMDWERGMGAHVPSLMDCRSLANLAWAAAEVELAAGSPAAAVDVLLDGAQFGGDLLQSPSLIGGFIGRAVLSASLQDALVDHGMLQRLPAPELARLAAALRKLDARLETRGLAREAELACFARSFEQARVNGTRLSVEPGLRSWENGFSETLGGAAVFEEGLRVQAELTGIESLPWAAAKAQLEGVDARAEDTNLTLLGFQVSVELSCRIAVAELRLMIGAAEARAGVEGKLLLDPFGSKFVAKETPEGMSLRSVGPNGLADAERYPNLVVVVSKDSESETSEAGRPRSSRLGRCRPATARSRPRSRHRNRMWGTTGPS
jgi:hypothetical protein